MLEVMVPESEFYDTSQNRFILVPSCVLTLEHSLISAAKWEAKWHTSYFGGQSLNRAQFLDYIRCMVIGSVKNPLVFEGLTSQNLADIKAYIDDSMTATTIKEKAQKKSKKVTTAEVLYARMFANNIPMECQKWHLNRLLTLIRVCEQQNGPSQKMSKRQTAMWNAEQNAARRAKLNSRG